jgi:hypothetical protein
MERQARREKSGMGRARIGLAGEAWHGAAWRGQARNGSNRHFYKRINMATKNLNDKATIEQLVANTRELLEKQFRQAFFLKDDDGKIKISFTHTVATNEFNELIATSKIAFGKKIHETIEHAVDTTQTQLDLSDKPDESK